jgi:processive 1,2-diacylglycerol beta-glucosyltransferase
MRILILSSSTGGGHDMRARSFEQWSKATKSHAPALSTHRYQALEENAGVYRFGVQVYNLIQKKCPALHHLYFNWLEVFQVSAHERLLLGKQRFIAVLKKTEPDIIISVHAHTNHAFRAIAKTTLPRVSFVTYCGEMFGGYGFSRHWVDPQADAFIGATEAVCAAAAGLGMPAEKIKYGGFMLNPKFYAAALCAEEKERLANKELNLQANQFTLLLSTGANGAHNHLGFIQALENARLTIQVIALCGRDDSAREAVAAIQSSLRYVSLRALGHRNDMFKLMQIADAIVARPGTGTTSEAIMAGCPLLLNTLGGIMPQEWITVKYLRSQGVPAQRLKKPTDLARQIQQLSTHPEQLTALKQTMIALQPGMHPDELLDYIVNLACR